MGQTLDFLTSLARPLTRAANRVLRPTTRFTHFRDGSKLLSIERLRAKSGSRYLDHAVRLGPNTVHVFVTHPDGSISQESLSRNLMTYAGQNLLAAAFGFQAAGATLASYISSATAAGSITTTGTVLTASNLSTPQPGVAGMRVYAAPHTTTNPVVWGNAYSNTTSQINVDQWWKFAAAAAGVPITGTTPTIGDGFVLAPCGLAGVQYMALSADAGAASAADTVLASEITTNSLGRALCTYSHSFSASSFLSLTLQSVFSPSGTQTGIVKMGLFSDSKQNSGGPMVFEDTFSSTNVLSADTLTVSDAISISG